MTNKRIGVVGAGLMGSEIAFVFAIAGHDVLLTDTSEEQLERALTGLRRVFAKGVERGTYTAGQEAALSRIRTTSRLEDFADRDLVIEAVFEDEAAKRATFERLDALCPKECILASNTSSISISVLASAVSRERRVHFLGTHFFSPVSRMKLVEVIPGLDTDEATIQTVMELCRDAGKEPIRVKDVVGFAVNRLLHAFWIEAARLVEEGVASPADVDKACKLGLGHPVGPFELMDLLTNSLTLQVQEILHAAYGPRFMPRPLLKQLVQAGYIGRKTKRGWYEHEG